MGLAGARNSAVTGLSAQSQNIAISADNIANAATPGYKSTIGQFSTLITGSDSSAGYSSGGVKLSPKTVVETQGLIQTTGRSTDLAISGNGFFAVQDEGGATLLTRAGSFDTNNQGELINAAGYKMMAWPLDDNGRLPGAAGNSNTTAAETIDSLVVVDTNTASGAATATSSVSIGANLNAAQQVFQGATVTLDLQSTANADLGQSDIIGREGNIQIGDTISFSSNSINSTFNYGGFSQSYDLNTTPVFGAATPTGAFQTGNDLAEGDKFTITSQSSGTVTFTFTQNSPDTSAGEFNSLSTLAEALDGAGGLTARLDDGQIYVSSTDATESLTFAGLNNNNLAKELGFSNVSALDGRFNTIEGLKNLVNETEQLGALVNSPATGSTLEVFAADPTLSLTVTKNSTVSRVNIVGSENGENTKDDLIVPVAAENSTMIPDTSAITITNLGNTDTFTYGGIGESDEISTDNTIFGASTSDGAFADGTGGLDDGDDITFSDGTNTVTVTFNADLDNVDTSSGEFGSLETLAEAINADSNFLARVVNNKLYVGTADPDLALSVSSADITTAQISAALGGDFAATGAIYAAAGAGVDRFNSLDTLRLLIDGVTSLTTAKTTLDDAINAEFTITADDGDTSTSDQLVISETSGSQLLQTLGLSSGSIGDDFFAEVGIDETVEADANTATIARSYDSTDSGVNLSGGNIDAHFSRNISLYDSLGTAHDFKIAFLKTNINTWAVEIHALNPDEVTGATAGQIAAGVVQFNGDGSLKSVSAGLTAPVTVSWSNGALSSEVIFELGTAGDPAGTDGATEIGLTDGLRQFDSSYNVEFVEQNGVASGLFTGVEVTEEGVINALFTNGEIKPIYQVPIITVASQNLLSQKTGNVFAVTQESGEINLKQAGQGSAGVIVAASLEGSTSDITEELTKTIGIQSNYNANATLISTVKAMEEELNRRI